MKRYVILMDGKNLTKVQCEHEPSLEFFKKLIGCQWIEAVNLHGKSIIFDEEYLVHNKPNINPVASFLAGHFIHGKVVLAGLGDGDFEGLSEAEADRFLTKAKFVLKN